MRIQAASEDELRLQLGLQSYTTGKGKVDLKDTNVRPIEVFMCSVVRPVDRGALVNTARFQACESVAEPRGCTASLQLACSLSQCAASGHPCALPHEALASLTGLSCITKAILLDLKTDCGMM